VQKQLTESDTSVTYLFHRWRIQN